MTFKNSTKDCFGPESISGNENRATLSPPVKSFEADTRRRRFMNSKLVTEGLDKPKVAKKTYRKPEILMYGNIREITKNLGPKGNSDGGGGAAAGPKTGT